MPNKITVKDRSQANADAGDITGTPRQVANLSSGFELPAHQAWVDSTSATPVSGSDAVAKSVAKSAIAHPNTIRGSITGTVAQLDPTSPKPAGDGFTAYPQHPSKRGAIT